MLELQFVVYTVTNTNQWSLTFLTMSLVSLLLKPCLITERIRREMDQS